MRAVPDTAYAFVREKEGLKLSVSADIGGTLDAGYGHDVTGLRSGQGITQRQAELWLKQDLNTAAARLSKVVDEAVLLALTDNQYAALLSFVFNLGCQPTWTIWKTLNARDFDHVPEQMMRFVYCKGNKVQGLVNRRAAEVALWSTQEPGSVPDVPSSAVTRAEATPPLPAKPQSVKAHVVTAVCAAGAYCAQYAKPVKDAADQLAAFTGAPVIAHLSQILLTAAGIATLAGLVVAFLKNKQAAQ
jgi:GH24 family phage-related lysozyme (muramidase)